MSHQRSTRSYLIDAGTVEHDLLRHTSHIDTGASKSRCSLNQSYLSTILSCTPSTADTSRASSNDKEIKVIVLLAVTHTVSTTFKCSRYAKMGCMRAAQAHKARARNGASPTTVGFAGGAQPLWQHLSHQCAVTQC
jgi:hypothetical protein